MENLFKCSVCGYTNEKDSLGDNCPKCGAPREKFIELDEETSGKIRAADATNDIHMDIVNLAMAIEELAREGIELDLDPGCVDAFEKAIQAAWEMKQISKAELAIHMNKGKW
ncbi:MAG TPA: rubredoxin [Clostridiales bacterium]|jgi:predicted  nucleic acid-binding Zn-ribbon protein|nr:rubredoxin [Clostridiales bacterium]